MLWPIECDQSDAAWVLTQVYPNLRDLSPGSATSAESRENENVVLLVDKVKKKKKVIKNTKIESSPFFHSVSLKSSWYS